MQPAGVLVSQERLGLFDTPPGRREMVMALAAVGVLSAASLAILPVRNIPVAEAAAFAPAVNSIVFVGELIIATMLFAQAAVFRSRALTALAAGFVFIALLLVPHTLTFPGAFAPDGLLAPGLNSTA